MASTSNTAVFDKATRLAIDHLIYDDPSHPLYQRNLDQVVDAITEMAQQRGETGSFPPSLNSALALLHGSKTANEARAQRAEHKILKTWTKRTMRELAAGLAGTKNPLLDSNGGNLKVEDVSGQYKCEFSVTPLINIDDDTEAEVQPKTKKRTVSAGGEGGSKEASSARRGSTAKEGAASGSRPRRKTSRQFATPQDSNQSGSGSEGSKDDGDSSSEDEEGQEDEESEQSEQSNSESDSDSD